MAGNIWATDGSGRNFKSKRALREAIAAGETVTFVDTAYDTVLTAEEVRPHDVVVGPNPFTKRDWYAHLRRNSNGLLVVV